MEFSIYTYVYSRLLYNLYKFCFLRDESESSVFYHTLALKVLYNAWCGSLWFLFKEIKVLLKT